jgi:hypothetical protein
MTDTEKISFKTTLKKMAVDLLKERIANARAAMEEAQAAANEGEKSSVGDKYETSRAMAQNDRDIYARQLDAAERDLAFINKIDTSHLIDKIDVGAFVETSSGNYFLLTGLGDIKVNNEHCFFVAAGSPIGKVFFGHTTGDKVNFNGKDLVIDNVF